MGEKLDSQFPPGFAFSASSLLGDIRDLGQKPPLGFLIHSQSAQQEAGAKRSHFEDNSGRRGEESTLDFCAQDFQNDVGLSI